MAGILIIVLIPMASYSQELGMSFSFFFPRNGYFSNPVSPFSFRGLGISPSRYLALETGFTLYRMAGMNISDMPFETREPLMGPMFSVFIPGEAVVKIPLENFVFKLKGGGFTFYNLGNRINYGNFDRAAAPYYGWDIVNANLDFENNIGYGWMAGTEIILYFNRQFGINFEVNYLSGGSPLRLAGILNGASTVNGLESLNVYYEDSRLDFTGWEITLGILFNTK